MNMLDYVPCPEPLGAAVFRTGKFPMEQKRSAMLAKVLDSWLQRLVNQFQLEPAMWLQGRALNDTVGVNLLVEHAREWMPDLGLGIRPNGDPPRMLNADDLNRLRWDQMPQPKHETAFHLMNGSQAANAALPMFCGTGAVLYALLSSSAEVFLREQTALWLPTIGDPAFRAHPFYIPLFDCKSFEGQSVPLLLQWMGRAVVYLRESPEDGGMLIVCNHSEILNQLDCELQLLSDEMKSVLFETPMLRTHRPSPGQTDGTCEAGQ